MRLYGAVNIVYDQDNSNQISGSVNVCVSTVIEEDLSGESTLYGVVNNVIIKIDIIPDEIKQSLILSGVKFS